MIVCVEYRSRSICSSLNGSVPGPASMTSGASEIAPSVMLSPNAVYFVFAIVCDTRTVTPNPHDACFISASVTVQPTGVSPTANTVLDPGLHWTLYGVRPPVTVGSSKCTSVPCGLVASRTNAAGHAIWSSGGGG